MWQLCQIIMCLSIEESQNPPQLTHLTTLGALFLFELLVPHFHPVRCRNIRIVQLRLDRTIALELWYDWRRCSRSGLDWRCFAEFPCEFGDADSHFCRAEANNLLR